MRLLNKPKMFLSETQVHFSIYKKKGMVFHPFRLQTEGIDYSHFDAIVIINRVSIFAL